MQIPSDIQLHQAVSTLYIGDRGPWLEHLVEDEGLSIEQAFAALDNWQLVPYIDHEHGHMATLLKRNKEVHFAGFRRFRKRGYITPKRLRDFFQPILDKETFLVTKLAEGESAAFIEHLGFQQLGVTMDGFRTFILNEIKYPEVKSCMQAH